LLSIIDRLGADRPALAKSEKTTMAARLREYQDAVAQRCEALRRQLDIAEDFAGTLAAHSRSLMAARN
jgi:hypothetical protein